MRIKRLAMEEYAISGSAFKGGPGGDGDGFAGAVADPHHYLQPK